MHVALLVLLNFLSSSVIAEPADTAAQSPPTKHISITSFSYPPYYNEANERGHGFAADITMRAFQLGGVDATLKLVPIPRAKLALESGEAEVYLGSIRVFSESSIAQMDYQIIGWFNRVFFYKPSKFPDGLDVGADQVNLKQYSIVDVMGSAEEWRADGLNITYMVDIESAFRFLQAERADLYYSVDATGLLLLRDLFPEDNGGIVADSQIVSRGAIVVAWNKNAGLKYRREFDQGFRELVSSGEYREIIEKYFHGIEVPSGLMIGTEELRSNGGAVLK